MDPTNGYANGPRFPPQPHYLPAVELEHIPIQDGSVLSMPLIGPSLVREIMPGATQHLRTISNLQEAMAYTNRVRHGVFPAADDDVVQVRADFVTYRKRIYNAMILLPHGVNEWQEKQWNDFVRAMHNGHFDMKDIEAKSWQVAEEIIKLHEQGTTLSPKYDKSLKNMADRNLKCSKRMETIIYFLERYKSACLEVLNSDLTMQRFIGAPEAFLSDKQHNRITRQRAKQRATAAQASAAGPVAATPQALPPGVARPAVQPHLAVGRGQPDSSTMHDGTSAEPAATLRQPGKRERAEVDEVEIGAAVKKDQAAEA